MDHGNVTSVFKKKGVCILDEEFKIKPNSEKATRDKGLLDWVSRQEGVVY
jgi:hypothetical protein